MTVRTDPRYNTRPFAADTDDATKRLESAIGVAIDVTDAEIFHATVDGVDYVIHQVDPNIDPNSKAYQHYELLTEQPLTDEQFAQLVALQGEGGCAIYWGDKRLAWEPVNL